MCGGTTDDSEASLSAIGYSIDQLKPLVVFEWDELVEVQQSNLREGGNIPLCIAGGVVGHRNIEVQYLRPKAREGESQPRCGALCCVARGTGGPG